MSYADGAASALQQAVDAEMPGQVRVELAPCLERCDAPVAMTVQCKGGAGYVFSGIRPDADTQDIIATCRAYLNSPGGWIEDARPCGRLRFCLSARLPA